MKLNNPCSITELRIYCESFGESENNPLIQKLNDELLKSGFNINTKIISSLFKLTKHYSEDKYIDIGCLALSAIVHPSADTHNIYIDIIEDKIGPTDNSDLKSIIELTQNLKLIIAQEFINQNS